MSPSESAEGRDGDWKGGDPKAATGSPDAQQLEGAEQRVSEILIETVRGGPKYRNAEGYVRWGLIERDIKAAYRAALAFQPQPVSEPVDVGETDVVGLVNGWARPHHAHQVGAREAWVVEADEAFRTKDARPVQLVFLAPQSRGEQASREET